MTYPVQQQIEEADRLREGGRPVDAVLLYRRVLKEEPSNVRALYGWACAAFDRGNFPNAQRLFKQVLACDPGHAQAYAKLGIIHTQARRYGLARQCFEKTLALDPGFLPAYNNLAIVCLNMGDPWEAEKICRAGLARDSDYEPVYTALGKALHHQGRTAESLKSYEKSWVLAKDPQEKAKNLCNRGVVHADSGDAAAAMQYFEKALSRMPDYTPAHYAFSGVHKYEKFDPHIDQMEELLKKFPKISPQAAELHAALAKAYDDSADYDTAFTHYAQANFIVRAGYDYAPEQREIIFADIKKAFEKGFEKKALSAREGAITPIFIVGMPRSGTTLVEQILFSHPQVAAAGETIYMDQVVKRHVSMEFECLSAETLTAIRDEYLEKLARHAPGATIITDKMPENFWYVGLIRLLFPRAKIIHCRRDPMDCCFSIYRHMFTGFFPFAYDLKELGRYYRAYQDMMVFWHKRLPGFIHDICYEDLVSDPDRIVREVLEFCGLDFDPACLRFYAKERAVLTASALQVKRPLYKNAIGNWKKYEKNLRILAHEIGKS